MTAVCLKHLMWDALHYLVADRIDDQKFDEVFLKAVSRVKRKNAESIIFFVCRRTAKDYAFGHKLL